MAILKGNCKKCGATIKLDIGDATVDEVKKALSESQTFSCPGNHVELTGAYPNYWKVDEWERIEGEKTPTDEDWLADMKSKYAEVVDTAEMTKRGVITGFAMGLPMTNDGLAWDFTSAPSGKRWYYHG